MAVDRNKIVFYTGDPVDKIVADKVPRTIINDGNTIGAPSTWQSAKIVQQDFNNPYGKKCFVRGRWNIDGGAWNTFEAHQLFAFTIVIVNPVNPSSQGLGLLAAVSIGVADTFVRIVTANGHHSDVTIDATTTAESYTVVPHTFIIEYELFEIG